MCELAPRLGKHARHPVQEPVDLGRRREEDAAQHEAQHALGVRLRVQQRERRPPRAAEQKPALDAKMLAQPLDVVDQVRGRVVGDLRGRRRAAGTALVVEDDPPERRIVVAADGAAGCRRRAAVHEEQRHAGGVAALLPSASRGERRGRSIPLARGVQSG
jgi:hypothetical protein